MKPKQDMPDKLGTAKKQWVKPVVEIIATDMITAGSVHGNSEGAYIKYYSGHGAITKATYFS